MKVGEEAFALLRGFFSIGILTAWNEQMDLTIQGLPIGRVGNYFMRVFLQLWSDKRMKQAIDSKIARYPRYDVWVCEFSFD